MEVRKRVENDEEIVVCTLEAGDGFGERALRFENETRKGIYFHN